MTVVVRDANGMALTRGGGGGGRLKKFRLSAADDEYAIGNKKVMVFAPYLDQLYKSPYPFKALLESEQLEVNVVTEANADLAAVNTFPDYGLIILNTHGSPNSFAIKTKVEEFDAPKLPDNRAYTEDELKTLLALPNNLPLESVLNGDIELTAYLYESNQELAYVYSINVTENYIRKMPHLNKAVVFANHCWSGFTYKGPAESNLMEAWKSIGAVTYYGYAFDNGRSMKVSNVYCKRMEDSLLTNLVKNGDSTGISHLAADAINQYQDVDLSQGGNPVEVVADLTKIDYLNLVPNKGYGPLYFKLFGSDRYKYGCGTFTDPRDTNVYKLACIGDNTWMAENLRYNASGSLFAHNDPSTVKDYGRLYNYPIASMGQGSTTGTQTIQGICPNGWHIPNKLEWDNLESALNAADLAELAIMLQSPSPLWVADPELANPKRNSSGFSAMPAGNASKTSGGAALQYNNGNAYFVLSTKNPGIVSPESVYSAYIQQAKAGGQSAIARTGSQWVNPAGTPSVGDSYYSCRCVQNK